MRRAADRLILSLALVQGAFYVATGIWGLVDLESFQAVTGPKTDLWLVRTVAMLVLAIGGVLLVAAARLRLTFELALLAIGSALGLAAIDIVHARADIISDVYLLDALVELLLAAGWMVALWLLRDDARLWQGGIPARTQPGSWRGRRAP